MPGSVWDRSDWPLVQEVLAKIDQLAVVMAGQGLSITDYMSQITYLIFLKIDADFVELGTKSRFPSNCSWQSLLALQPQERLNHYEEILAALSNPRYENALVRAIFARATNKIERPLYFSKMVELIDEVDWLQYCGARNGDIYELMLGKFCQDVRTGAGQYFTPRVLTELIVELLDPQVEERVWDPACGTGGFLIAAFQHMQAQTMVSTQLERLRRDGVHGCDITPLVATLAAMNMFLHGCNQEISTIAIKDSLLEPQECVADIVLSNPPFGTRAVGSLEVVRDDFIITTRNNQLNFLQHIMSLLKFGGRAAVIVPENVLFEREGTAIRRELLSHFNLHTILSLPKGIFYAYGIRTYVLFFTKGQPTTDIWFYDLITGQNFSAQRNPLTREHLSDFIACYNAIGKGQIGERHETYDPQSNPNGRWRKFAAADFWQEKHCSLTVEPWVSAPKSEFELMELEDLLAAMQQNAQQVTASLEQVAALVASEKLDERPHAKV